MESIVGFGAGIDGHTFLAMAEGKIRIEYFIDNAQTGKIGACDIYPPSKEICLGKYIVVTTTDHYHDVKEQLEGYGLSERTDFVSIVDFLSMHKEMIKGEGLQLFLRDKKASVFGLHYMREFPEKENLAYEVYDHAVILPLKRFQEDHLSMGRGGVVRESGDYVSLSGIERGIWGKYDYKTPLYRDERVVYCGYLIHQWGHFLMEAAARLWYFLTNDDSVERYVFFVRESSENTVLDGNYKEFFRLLGVLDRIEIINEPVRYREVIVPQLSYSLYHHYYSRQYKDIFSKVIENAMAECREQYDDGNVYFSRSHWNKSEFGQDMLDDFFEKNGFRIFYPEKLTLTQMISILQKARTFAAVSGSAAHNILFGRDGQELILVERCALNNVYQIDINKIKKLDAAYIDANLSFFPVRYAEGPFLYHWNERLECYAKERNMKPPQARFRNPDYVCGNLRKYMDIYHRRAEFNQFQYELFEEAYRESIQDIKRETCHTDSFEVMDEIIKKGAVRMLNDKSDVPVYISVIVPILNVVRYIRECIESILNQTLQEIEVLCVDAGSTDGTLEILEEYAAKDERVRILKSDRKSYGYQMNLGIESAGGQYIGIVEPDDFIDVSMYQKLYSYTGKDQPDFVKGGFYDYAEAGGRKWVCANNLSGELGKLNNLQKEREKGFLCLNRIWAGIYRRNFLLEKGIRFHETPGASYQDTSFSMLAGFLADTCTYIEGSYYYYRRNNENSSVKSNFKWRCVIDEMEYVAQEMKKRRDYSADTELLLWKYKPVFYFWNFQRLPEQERGRFLAEINWELEQYTENSVFRDSLSGGPKEMVDIMKNREASENYFAEKAALEEKYKKLIALAKQGEKFVLAGAGRYGENMLRLQEMAGIRYIDAVADNNEKRQGSVWNGYKLMGIPEAVHKYRAHRYIIANKKHSDEIWKQLKGAGVHADKILVFDKIIPAPEIIGLAMEDFEAAD